MSRVNIPSALLARVRRHSRFDEQVDAYVDNELPASETARFEGHLAGCAACTRAVREGRELKSLFASLPPVRAPRSFRLTPEMVAPVAAGRAEPVRQPSMALRVTQMTAGVAIMALVTVAAIDLSGGHSSSDEQALMTTSAIDNTAKGAPVAQGAAAGVAAGDGTGESSSAPRDFTSPAASARDPGGVQTSGAAPPNGSKADSPASEGAAAGGSRTANPKEPDGNGERSGLRLAEIILIAIAAAAGASWFLLARRTRRF